MSRPIRSGVARSRTHRNRLSWGQRATRLIAVGRFTHRDIGCRVDEVGDQWQLSGFVRVRPDDGATHVTFRESGSYMSMTLNHDETILLLATAQGRTDRVRPWGAPAPARRSRRRTDARSPARTAAERDTDRLMPDTSQA